MTKIILSNLCLLFLIACQSTRQYEVKEMEKLSKKYRTKVTPDADRPVETRKELKIRLQKLERYLALMPDSIVIQGESGDHAKDAAIDSFYTSHNKIIYLKKHNLASPHRILVEPTPRYSHN